MTPPTADSAGKDVPWGRYVSLALASPQVLNLHAVMGILSAFPMTPQTAASVGKNVPSGKHASLVHANQVSVPHIVTDDLLILHLVPKTAASAVSLVLRDLAEAVVV